MPSAANYGSLNFAEQIEFFRRKVPLPTQAWTDIVHEQHDRSFVVAGANRLDMVEDFQAAIDKAIAGGGTLADFRKDFDAIVAKYGWDYNGGRNWRSRVIYETNLRTSYAAGRWAQLQAVKAVRPYWQYVHSDAVQVPRPLHLAWNGLVLDADNEWWLTHYPPNGWGCQCTVRALNGRDLQRLGKSGPDTAPKVVMQSITIGTKGPTPRVVEVLEGVDPGFGYAPGRSFVDTLSPTFEPEPQLQVTAQRLHAERVGDMPAPLEVSADRLLPANTPIEAAIDRFLEEFGATAESPTVMIDPIGTPQLISHALFEDVATQDVLPAVENLTPELLLIADTLRAPDEVWLFWQPVTDPSGAVMHELRQRYIRQVLINGQRHLVVVDVGRNAWSTFTLSGAEAAQALQAQRVGERVWWRGQNTGSP